MVVCNPNDVQCMAITLTPSRDCNITLSISLVTTNSDHDCFIAITLRLFRSRLPYHDKGCCFMTTLSKSLHCNRYISALLAIKWMCVKLLSHTRTFSLYSCLLSLSNVPFKEITPLDALMMKTPWSLVAKKRQFQRSKIYIVFSGN